MVGLLQCVAGVNPGDEAAIRFDELLPRLRDILRELNPPEFSLRLGSSSQLRCCTRHRTLR
jgi:hypothetical protein